MALLLAAVVFEATDRVALARFWAAALDWDYHDDEAEGLSSASGGDGALRHLEFETSSNEKQSANWMHFDLSSTSVEDQRATVERLLDLGARHLDIGQGPDSDHVVMADPEGNEFCVLEPGNSFVDADRRLGSLTCDGSPAAGAFWSEALGWPLVWDQDGETAMRPPGGGLFITFGGPSAPRDVKNRIHIDIAPSADGDQHAEVERLVALGATRIDIGQGEVSWVVMADPDGNEFCVLTPR
jgi:catechol 2,3-dioxygenase-like lactoylglutathione lyase family enzyme/predicted enzyme related to lactoylglutathione lyase